MIKLDYIEKSIEMALVFVAGGSFDMGDAFGDGFANERPVHEVCVDDFYIGKYPVTQAQWQHVMGINPACFQSGDDYPVENVSWDDIQVFIEALNNTVAGIYRLPTEAEWEFAARSGGKRYKWSGTNDADAVFDYGWFDKNAEQASHSVGLKKPNELGIYDLCGNVSELVADTYMDDAYQHHAYRNPEQLGASDERILRGGSWYHYASLLTCTDRSIYNRHYRNNYVGFRLVKVV